MTLADWRDRAPDMAAVDRLITEVGEAEVMPRFRRLGKSDVREKRPGDLVTVVDEICEQKLGEGLTALLPGSLIVGEEGVARDPGQLDHIGGEAPVWLIDPIDGTTNFVRGRERFTIIVALVHRGRTLAGWIHHPSKKVTATATAGQGAFLQGHRMLIEEPRSLGDLAVVLGIPSKRGWRREAGLRLAGATRTHSPIGSAGATYLDLLTGKTHLALFAGMKPWDHAAGVLIHREAGGYAALADGRAYAPTVHQGTLLAAPGRRLWESAHAVMGSPPTSDAA
jgi:fructose-1,6-bisphosphatase/inositol monophosphatase family enzyme